IYLIHRRDEFRAEKVLVDKARSNDKIEFLLNYEVDEIFGEKKVEGITIRSTKDAQTKTINLDGLFVAIGYIPRTEIFEGQIELDEKGYITTKERSMTSVNGVFVA